MAIDIQVMDDNGVRVFTVSGQIDSVTAVKLGEQLQRALNRDVTQLVLELGDVNYLTSAGVREIMSAVQRAQEKGGDLRLANPSARVTEVLELTGLINELRSFPTRADAVQSFG